MHRVRPPLLALGDWSVLEDEDKQRCKNKGRSEHDEKHEREEEVDKERVTVLRGVIRKG